MTTTYPRELHIPEFDAEPLDPAAMAQARLEDAAAKLAVAVRWLYINSYRDFTGDRNYGHGAIKAWDGGTDGYGRRTKPVWPLIAKCIVSVGADPATFIRAQFWGKVNLRPPAPNTFYNELAITTWRAFCDPLVALDAKRRELHNDRCSVEDAVASHVYALKWTEDEALRFALCDKSHVYSTPLYRHCRAAEAGYTGIAEYFFERALLQLLFQYDLYVKVYGDLIPMALHNAVRELRRCLGLA